MNLQKSQKWLLPVALLGLLVVAFGLLIPALGFYWDDWPVIYMAHSGGEASTFIDFYTYDRPISAWTYILTVPILGVRPLNWHIFTLVLRWLTVLAMWWTLRGLWPERSRQVAWMAFLFAVYPAFFQQPIAVAYSQHFITYALFFLSLGAMVWAQRRPRYFWPFTILALLTTPLHLLTMEYFVGMELIRPLLLWLLVRGEGDSVRHRAGRTFKAWWPYLLALAGFVVWRLFFLHIPDDPNPPRLLYALQDNPLSALIDLAQTMVRDFLQISVATWFQTLDPVLIDFKDRFLLFSWGVVVAAALALGFFMARAHFNEDDGSPKDNWQAQSLVLGIYSLLAGMAPVWFTGRDLIVGLYADRFALSAMFGASVLLVSVLSLFTRRRLQQTIVLSVLVGLAVGVHLRVANGYRWNWTEQTRFYWQLAWRAPGLQAGTPLTSGNAVFKYVDGYSLAAALNTLYPQSDAYPGLDYWFFELDHGFYRNPDEFIQGQELNAGLRTFDYEGNSSDTLLVYYEPEGRCLWVLDERFAYNLEVSEISREFLPAATLDGILPDGGTPGYPSEDIFGAEPEYTWCYMYQKAELARQQGDWDAVLTIWEDALKAGHEPNNSFEYLPFIEAYVAREQWDDAHLLSIQTYRENFKTQATLCNLWDRIAAENAQSATLDAAVEDVRSVVGCP